ncbi:hypothetical protein CAPTEDRAFT_103958 [Capitella teleta]|uniref:Thymidine phosphorylase n=1 Tax=Capitella teleta TaxID=283909 RepID=R7UE25_CAPTE|nr:hypothetical protein CAPTEDRAFT_103958 [Capitella teleta]|eukprot:ELU04346.1 hypothetical protein CAPTEDRAFT_103958 [Capitella teleta]
MTNGSEVHPLNIVDIIKKKKNAGCLTAEEIDHFIQGTLDVSITDAQIGAMLMAICINGMNNDETANLTKSMIKTSTSLKHPPSWKGSVVGKHSTGGVGDKTSLILIPAIAACGLKFPKISGRGLGHTGGTLDKLESIPGLRTSFSAEQITDIVERVGCCLVAQTDALVPADKLLYAIRDTTGTTESIPLVAGSVMCKKAAENLDSLVLEVTYGQAALVKNEKDGLTLAKAMLDTGNSLGIKTVAVLTKMFNPIGRTIGNALEVIEAVGCLAGNGPPDLEEAVCTLGSYLLLTMDKVTSFEEGREVIKATLEDGTAMEKFRQMIVAQGATDEVASRVANISTVSEVLPAALHITELKSRVTGYVTEIDAYTCACISRNLGAGRQTPSDDINHAVGLELLVSIGTPLNEGKRDLEIRGSTSISCVMQQEIYGLKFIMTALISRRLGCKSSQRPSRYQILVLRRSPVLLLRRC